MEWAGWETGNLSCHEWSSHWSSLGHVKLSRFCHSNGTSYKCIATILTLV
jgi:hypothetical protein